MYLDANFIIFAYLLSGKQAAHARNILNEIIGGKHAITSSLALDEVMWVILKKKLGHEIRHIIEDVYKTKNVEVKEVSATIPLRALDIMEKHNLKPRDAFHVAVMEHFGIKEIVSDDEDFDKVPNIQRIKIE